MRLQKKEKGVPHMLVFITQKFIMMSQKKGFFHVIETNKLPITYFITNSKFSIDLRYNSADLLQANKDSYMLLIKQLVRIR